MLDLTVFSHLPALAFLTIFLFHLVPVADFVKLLLNPLVVLFALLDRFLVKCTKCDSSIGFAVSIAGVI